MRVARYLSLLLIGGMLAVAGCGGTATLVDPTANDQAKQLKTATPTPVIVMPTPTPTPTPVVNAQLIVTVKDVDKATLGLGKLKATLEIKNPSTILLTGTLKITFTKKGQPTEDVQTKTVSVPPLQTQTLNVTSSNWFEDNVQAVIDQANGGYDPHGIPSQTGGSY
ncbi:MAG TPA: hypothetical protein V6D05_12990 [Stenomitos sp.]